MFALQLQDLADSPTIRNPSVNTAECVIQGHQPDFATGRSDYVRAMLWLSMFFVIFSGPLLAKNIRDIEDLSLKNRNSDKKNKYEAVCFSFYFLSVLSSLLIVFAFALSITYWKLGGTFHFTVIIIIIFVLSSLESFCVIRWFEYGDSKLLFLLKIYGGHAISYILCWIIIGIRINPTWGLLLFLFSLFPLLSLMQSTFTLKNSPMVIATVLAALLLPIVLPLVLLIVTVVILTKIPHKPKSFV